VLLAYRQFAVRPTGQCLPAAARSRRRGSYR
jgi:hypothetical protein